MSVKPETVERIKRAHFTHMALTGLSYQCCRFCRIGAAHTDHVDHDPACWFLKNEGECRGLWKYNVRHYVCSPCREKILASAA